MEKMGKIGKKRSRVEVVVAAGDVCGEDDGDHTATGLFGGDTIGAHAVHGGVRTFASCSLHVAHVRRSMRE